MEPPGKSMSELYDSQVKYDERPKTTFRPALIGILLLISAGINFPLVFINLSWWGILGFWIPIVIGVGLFCLACSIACLVGSYFSFKRRHHKIVLLASVLAVIPTVIFGLAALVLLASAEDEFLS
ncbi:MAG: hypothetical protein R6W91_04400 [Thermoplasmata archaeon]